MTSRKTLTTLQTTVSRIGVANWMESVRVGCIGDNPGF
jgi:hypothetical protein